MTPRRPRDLAELFLEKAKQDETALRELLDNRRVTDTILGFHAQQAVEKAIKAVLISRQVRVGKTHDLTALIDLVEASHRAPDWLTEVETLTRFAVTLRYPEASLDEPLDREAAAEVVRRVLEWAQREVGAGP